MHSLLKTKRKAIAMIELIFAIVIMGIVMLSAPLMVSTATQSSSVAFQQESIAIAAAHANTLMTYAWDEKNTNSYKIDSGGSPNNILTVANGHGDIDSAYRLIASAYLRTPDGNLSSVRGTFGGQDGNNSVLGLKAELIKDDVDDFHGASASLSIANGTSTSAKSFEDDYMDTDITLSTDIAYFNDSPTSNYAACKTTGCAFSKLFDDTETQPASSNIKRIKVTLESGNVDDKKIILRSFMCNIGAATPLKRGSI